MREEREREREIERKKVPESIFNRLSISVGIMWLETESDAYWYITCKMVARGT